MASSIWHEIGRALRTILLSASKSASKPSPTATKPQSWPKLTDRQGSAPTGARRKTSQSDAAASDSAWADSPGQSGVGATVDVAAADVAKVVVSYAPDPDGDPDPGEIVWTWVPYVENDGRGKDRPVLIIGRLGSDAVAGCYLSTKQHLGFVSIGSGAWDSQGRESFLSTERLLRVTALGMRREGHVLPRDRFERAVAAAAQEFGFRA